MGKDLHVSLEGDSLDQPTVIIEDFFLHNGELIGMAESGAYYPYISSNGDDDNAVAAMLLDGESSPLVLGGEQLPSSESYSILGALGVLALGMGAIGAMVSQGRPGKHGGGGKSDAPQSPEVLQPAPDVTSPSLSQVIDNKGSLQGAITAGSETDDNTPTFLGSSGTPGNTIIFYDNGKKIGEVEVGQDGRWSFTPRDPLDDGAHSITMVEQNADGKVSSPSDAFELVVDTVSPAAPVIAGIFDDVGSETGAQEPGAITDDTRPTLTGKAESGAKVEIYDNGNKIGETTANANGDWSFTPESELAKGEHSFTTRATDVAGNASEMSQPWDLVIDIISPIQPKVDGQVPDISEIIDDQGPVQGPIAKGDITDDTMPTLNGKGEPGDTIIITDNGDKIGETTVDNDGNWSFTPETELGEGEHEISVIVEDKAGNQSKPSDPWVVTVDTTPPDTPLIDSIYDSVGNKTGAIKLGEVTDDNRPVMNGRAEVGSKVEIYDHDKKIGETTADATGNWSYTPDLALDVGNHAITVKAIDAAGNMSEPSSVFDFSLIAANALSAPAIIAVLDDVGSIQGTLQKNAVTDDVRPTLVGTSEPGMIISIYNHGELLGNVVTDASGQWRFTPESDLPEGLNNLSALATDAAGNISPQTGDYPLIIDTTPPAAIESGELLDDVGNIQGAIVNGTVTDDAQPTFNGKAEPGSTVVIYDKGTEIGRVVSDSNGEWSFTPDTALTDGEHRLAAKVVDLAGNESNISAPITFTVDTRLVDVSIDVVLDDFGAKQGSISKGGVTDDATPTFSGRALPDSTVVLYDKGVELGSVTSDAFGHWSFTPQTPMAEGNHAITATVTSLAGGESQATPVFDFNIDITPPGKPGNDGESGIGSVIDDVGVVQGPVANGGTTDDTTPTFSGRGEPGDTVHIFDNDKPLGSVEVQPDGNWTFTPPPMSEGEHEITVSIEDPAGNQSKPSDPWVVIVDTTAPDVPTIGSIYDDVGEKTGVLEPGDITDDTMPTLRGQAEAGAKVELYDNGKKIGETTADAEGNWAFTPESELAEGEHRFTVSATDGAGNQSGSSEAWQITIVVQLPEMPVIESVMDDVGPLTGALTSGDVTDDRRPEISGRSEPDVTVIVYDQGVEIGRTKADAQGRWSVTPENDLNDGESSFTAVVVNVAGNSSAASDPFELIVYTGSGPTQVAYLSQMGKDSGYDGNDFVSDNGGAGRLMHGTLSAELTVGQTLQVSTDGGRNWFNALANGTKWAAQDLSLHAASWTIQTRVMDQSGNTGIVTSQEVTLDITASRAPAAVRLEGSRLLVEFDPLNVAVGERIAVVADDGTQRFEHTLTAQDIAAGSVTLDVGSANSASVALVDLAGNLSGFTNTSGSVPGVNMTVTGDVSEIYGHHRDNIFTVDDVNALNSVKVIEGNGGIDTLKLTGADQVLDLSAWTGRLSSLEVIDITGSGNNTLKLSLGDVLEQGSHGAFINENTVQLAVKGDAGDVVMLSDLLPNGMDVGDWESLGEVISAGISYDVYHHTGLEADVLVQQGVDVQFH
ncbi:Ig-like domain-containing protein [Serratia sp. D1N4]